MLVLTELNQKKLRLEWLEIIAIIMKALKDSFNFLHFRDTSNAIG